jgi:hypothetical protein
MAMMARAKWAKATVIVLALGGTAWLWQVSPGGGMPATSAQQADPKIDPRVEPKSDPKSKPPAVRADERIRPGDRLQIWAKNDFETSPATGLYLVERGGTVTLGPTYGGRVKVEGLTIEEAEATLQKHMRLYAKKVEVTASFSITMTELESKLERRVQQLEQEVLELRAAIRELQKARDK